MKFKIASLVFAICASSAYSESVTTYIEDIGCHKNDNICFIRIETIVGPAACQSSSVRFETAKDAAGTSALALFTAAFFADKHVRLQISNSCFAYQSGYPTFDWFHVLD